MARSGAMGGTQRDNRLIGRYELTIDDKGRLVLPAVHRARYAEGAVLANRGDHIAIYQPAAWDDVVGRLATRRNQGEISRREFNLFTMNAADVKADSAGRILVPTFLRDDVGLDRDVLVGGAYDYLGIYPIGYLTDSDPAERRATSDKIDVMGF